MDWKEAFARLWGLSPDELERFCALPELETHQSGRYRVLGPLGRGGQAEVYRMLDLTLGREVAVKLGPSMRHQPELALRFEREARVASSLAHPGVVPIYTLLRRPGGSPAYAMRVVDGETLHSGIRRFHRARATPQAGALLRRLIDHFHRVCQTVAYAHARGVLHLDLKPDNIMIGAFGEVMVIDWGLAQLTGADPLPPSAGLPQGGPGVSRDGVVGGTPHYMAPEQARGQNTRLDPRTDVYGLGAILFHILSGRKPFDDQHFMDLQAMDPYPTPTPPDLSVPGVGLLDELSAYAVQAMDPEPRRRFPDAAALAEVVGRWLDGASRHEQASGLVALADAPEARWRALLQEAVELDGIVAAAQERLESYSPIADKVRVWDLEQQASQLRLQAEAHQAEALKHLHAALSLVGDLPEAHARLARYHQAAHADAEARADRVPAALHLERLRQHDREGTYAAYIEGKGRLTLHTDPPGARVEIFRYVPVGRRLVPRRVPGTHQTPLVELRLDPGSYLLLLTAPGRAPVAYPVVIERLQHWQALPPGAPEPVAIPLPPRDALGPGEVYVAPGWSRVGGDPHAVDPFHARTIWIDGFIAQRTAVTVGAWFGFLNALLRAGRAEEALRCAPGDAPRKGGPGAPIYQLRDGVLVPGDDGPGGLWQDDWPVSQVDLDAALSYIQWVSRDGQPWRLPHELEYERMARGADGRAFPWGDDMEPMFANVLGTRPDGASREPVTARPQDRSPFGLRGLTGGVRTWCHNPLPTMTSALQLDRLTVAPEPDTTTNRAVRGGSWANLLPMGRAAGRFYAAPEARRPIIGLRLVRTWGSSDP